ncbi:MAG: M20/M25/M40 family metallo-hydrolase [Bacteroidetes bacterium]|nr:M20/M25/M40 family metallo-hydrolase [Bacteroidota bacterium]
MKKIQLLLLLSSITCLKIMAQEINVKEIYRDVYFLANDKLEGRATGQKGCESAANYLAKRFSQIGLIPKGDNGTYLKAYQVKVPANPHATVDSAAKEIHSANVLGFIDNKAENTIVIGAHYDHLGMGNDGNSLDANPKGKVHNGADDNASGVAGLLALASYYQKNNSTEKNNFLFICFSGEELGLYGSKKFCENPAVSLDKIDFMLNMDMIGRLDSLNRLLIYGVGTAPEFVSIVNANNTNFKLKLDSSGIGPSDHTSFYLKDIPVLHFFTGQHSDYHKPSDDAQKVNYGGEKKVLEYIVKLINELDKLPKLKFTKTRNADSENAPKFKVTLGIMPDYVFEGVGVRADGVSDGKPASKAGLVKGDVIVKLGDIVVKDMQTYMEALSKFKKGDSTKVEVQRGKESKIFDLTF